MLFFSGEKSSSLTGKVTESFLDIYVMYFCFRQLFSNRLSENFQHQLFHEFTFPVLQTEAGPAQSVERWPAEREFAGSSPGVRTIQGQKTAEE